MNVGVAVAVGDIDIAAQSDRDIRRMIERQPEPGLMAFAQGRQQPPVGIEDQDLVRVPVASSTRSSEVMKIPCGSLIGAASHDAARSPSGVRTTIGAPVL